MPQETTSSYLFNAPDATLLKQMQYLALIQPVKSRMRGFYLSGSIFFYGSPDDPGKRIL
jgi:hypothetical protein